MNENMISKMPYVLLGMLIVICFFVLTGFRLPGPPEPTAGYQFYKEEGKPGFWVFEPESGTSKYFDVEKGLVIINSFQMDSISVKTDVKTTRSKG